MPFVKGQSGNPSGRAKTLLPDGRSLTDLAKEHTVEAVQCLLDTIRDKSVKVSTRVHAATAILDRGWGRPHQTVSADLAVVTEGAMSEEHLALEVWKMLNSAGPARPLIEGEFIEVREDGSDLV